ncbi:CIC11C00000005466 [Sungouiella intermedia]|uniref:CIC11C00000005466 n=1 Tax=Sungouiella intermedia TaxID=45354 RepID=A0A1L0D623_9ASCO|nr:CIC11C00000005466 [[Candida] intermedia]
MSAPDCAADDTPANSRVVDLSTGPLPIGRASARDGGRSAKLNNLYIRNSHLSKIHARVWVEDGAVYLEDVGSTFGTIWNNNLLVPDKPVAIYAGDSIGFVVNRPSDVLKNLISKTLNGPMVLLDKLLNPRVQLQYVVHSVDLDKRILVLLPVNDTTADASVDLVVDENDFEVTPDVVPQVVNVLAADSDDDAPVEEPIVKDSFHYDKTQDVEFIDDESGDECIVVVENADQIDSYSDDLDEHDDSEVEDADDYCCECNEDYDYAYELADEDDLVQRTSCHLVVPTEESEDDSDYDEETDDNELSELDSSHGEILIVNASLGIKDCCVPKVDAVLDETYSSESDDDTFDPLQHDNENCDCSEDFSDENDSEVETPNSCSESECIFNSFHYSDDDTVSENEASACECCEANSKCQLFLPLMMACPTTSFEASRKRSYDDAELEDIDDEKLVKKVKKAQPSTLRTVLKEVGKGLFYVTGTIIALAAYGKQLDNQ